MFRRSLPAAFLLLSAALSLGLPASVRADEPGAPAAVAPVQPTELPLTRAVLFSSGVGYFEHSGTIDDTASVRLQFKTDQINDVLKSMVIMDEAGNLPSVNYPSNDPIERSLKSFGVDLSGNPTLPDLLTQLRGAQVVVSAPDKIAGAILSVEPQNKVIPGPTPVQTTDYMITLSTPAGIRSVQLSTVSRIEFVDPKLQDEMTKALALLVASRDTDRKPVDIKFDGKGKRQVRVGYLVETPVWKTSYRLDLSAEKPLLQGWAIVENTSDTDWQNVKLGLVSGRPISFTMDLYTPMYLKRPEVVQQQYSFLRPQVYAEGMDKDAERGAAMDRKGAMPMAMAKAARFGANEQAMQNVTGRMIQSNMNAPMAAGMGGGGGGMAMDAVSANGISFNAAAESMAQGQSVGELFEFDIKNPITMPRRKSAMLNIINQTVEAEKVSIYNAGVLRDRPLNGVMLTNSTSLKMLAGPITVFDGEAYAGDAQIDSLAPGDKRLLSYAVDLSVTADSSANVVQQLMTAKIVKGVLYLTRMNTFTQEYKFKNKGKVDRTIIVEHPVTPGRNLIEPAKFDEKTSTIYRFRFKVAAGKTETLPVKEQQPYGETISLIDYNADPILMYSNDTQIPQAVREALSKVAASKQRLATLQREQQTLQTELTRISTDQDRLRRDIESVGRDSNMGRRYIDKMGTQENRIEEIQKRLVELQKQIEDGQKELSDLVLNLNVGNN